MHNKCFLKYDLYLTDVSPPLQRTGTFPSKKKKTDKIEIWLNKEEKAIKYIEQRLRKEYQ
jgi:hypothetical protein